MTVNRDYCRPRAAPRSAFFGGRAVVFFGAVVAVVAACFAREWGSADTAAGKPAIAAAPASVAAARPAVDVVEPVVNQKDYAFYDRLQQSNVVLPTAEAAAAATRARAEARARRAAPDRDASRYPTRADAERRGASLSETL